MVVGGVVAVFSFKHKGLGSILLESSIFEHMLVLTAVPENLAALKMNWAEYVDGLK